MIISYVWVLETSTGATWRVGYLRLVSLVLILNACSADSCYDSQGLF
jgi:hypothetical protein